MSLQIDVDRYWRQGYLKVPNAFSPVEISDLRDKAIASKGIVGDLLNVPDLAPTVFDDRLVETARELLGEDPIYFGFSSANHAVTDATGSWHRDCADRLDFTASDWQSRYTLLRIGVYLQDHRRHSGGLNVRPTSHEAATSDTNKVAYIDSAVGDLVVWNLRILHSGDGQRMKFPRWINVDPAHYGRIPSWNLLPKPDSRIALFATYAIESVHLDYYIAYLKTRDFMQRMWRASTPTDEVLQMIDGSDLEYRNVKAELAD